MTHNPHTQAIWSLVTGIIETHAAGCSALNKAGMLGRGDKRQWRLVSPELVDDLLERGYPIRACRCLKWKVRVPGHAPFI